MIWGAATNATNSKLFIRIIHCYCLGTPTTLAAAAYTNAAISNGEATTYSATNMVTYTCNSGYLSSASVALVATCNAGSPDSWSLATGTTRGSCEGKKFCTTFLKNFLVPASCSTYSLGPSGDVNIVKLHLKTKAKVKNAAKFCNMAPHLFNKKIYQ